MSALPQVIEQTTQLQVIQSTRNDNPYARFFDLVGAEQAVYDHIATLPGGKPRDGKVGPSMRAYTRDLRVFIAFLHDPTIIDAYLIDAQSAQVRQRVHVAAQAARRGDFALPTPPLVSRYLAALSHLRSSTINRYLAPVRNFLGNLADQPLDFSSIADGREMFNLIEVQKAIRVASSTKGVADDETNYEAPILQHGNWLSYDQTIELLATVQRQNPDGTPNLRGLRDYALLVLGFNTALRAAELQRLTINSFKVSDPDKGIYTITVRGKRNNTTPVPCPKHAFDALLTYVRAYNATLPDGDPRRIADDQPVWRSLTARTDRIFTDAKRAQTPLGYTGIHGIVETRSERYGNRISPHDMRRTAALIAFQRGMGMKHIQTMLRHKSVGTTEKYLGEFRDYAAATLITYDCIIA